MEEEIADLDKTIQNVYEMGKIYKSESVLSAIDNYYKLKSKYEVSKKTKKTKCIFCGTEGFTIFKSININGNKTLIAECNSNTSCSKKIKILTGKIENFHEKISLLKQQIEKLKLKIIIYKNDILFGYINPDSTNKFEKIMTDFEKHTLELKIFMELYSDIIENHLNYERLKKLESSLYTQILNIKRDIMNYNNEQHQEDLDDAVNIFVEILSNFGGGDVGLLEKIMLLKYVQPSIEFDEKEKTVRLIQISKEYDIYSNEFSTLPIEVVANEKTSSTSKKAKTLKKPKDKTIPKDKTKTAKKKTKTVVEVLEVVEKEKEKEKEKGKNTLEDFWEQYPDSEEEQEEDGYIPQPKLVIEEQIEDKDIINAPEIEEVENLKVEEVDNLDELEEEDVIKGEAVDEIYILIDKIPNIVENGEFYDREIDFTITTKTTDALPGKGPGEKIPRDKERNFEKLGKVKNWRYYLSNYGIGEFVLDGKTWKTVEHYYQASKFKKNNPQFYNLFSLDSREPVEGHPELIISENVTLAKYAGTTGMYNDKEKGMIQIRPDEIEIDKDFFLPENVQEKDRYKFREKYELFIAQQTKFTTNEKMKKILKATKNAKLKYNDNNNSADNIMYIRAQLQ